MIINNNKHLLIRGRHYGRYYRFIARTVTLSQVELEILID